MTTRPSSRRRRRPSGGKTHDAATVRRKIIPARDMDPISSMLIYARNKVGKTTLCASASEIGKTLIIDIEKGGKSAKKKYPKAEIYKVTEFDEIEEIYWYLATQDHGYKFVCIDPISRLGQLAMTKVLQDNATMDLSADPMSPGRQEWGKTAEMLKKVITNYMALPNIFLIITAYERRRNSDDEDSEYDFVIGPDTQPAVKGFLMGQVDIISRLYIKRLDDDGGEDDGPRRVERRALFGTHEIYEAGDRSGNLPYVMRQPTMARIMDRINNTRRRED